jgi:hypothetical protein
VARLPCRMISMPTISLLRSMCLTQSVSKWRLRLPPCLANNPDQNVNTQLKHGEILRRQSYVPQQQQPQQFEADPTYALLTSAAINGELKATRIEATPVPSIPMLKHRLPGYLKPLPQRMTSVDIDYLFAKGALSLPDVPIRNALLRAYIEYVHPYMPLIEVHEILRIIEDGNGGQGRISLLLFQAIMFAGTAFVDMEHLRGAGYSNRKSARKAFFQKARVSVPQTECRALANNCRFSMTSTTKSTESHSFSPSSS